MTARRLTLALLTLLLAAVGWSSAAGTAHAGGPTSVLLVNPGAGQAAALYHSSRDYQRLVDAVNAYASDLGSADRPDSIPETANDAYRLTWLIHDMTIWRIDRVYATADDGLWLETVADETGSNPNAHSGRWHRVTKPAALTAVLTSAGLTDGSSPLPEVQSEDPGSAAAAASAPPTTGAGPMALATGIAGLILGAVGALLFRRARMGGERVVLSG